MTNSKKVNASFESYINEANKQLDELLGSIENSSNPSNKSNNPLLISLESYINKANESLNELLGDCCESKTVDALLEKVKATVNAKCGTVEDCDKFLDIIKTEQGKFNNALDRMKNAAIEYKEGKIDKAKFADIVKDASAEIKTMYNILVNGEAEANGTLDDEEVKFLRDFIIGAKAIVADKKATLTNAGEEGCGTDKTTATECGDGEDDGIDSFIKTLDDMEVPATESGVGVAVGVGLLWYIGAIAASLYALRKAKKKDPEFAYLWKMGRSKELRAANDAIKKAKKAAKAKDFDRAIELYEEAKVHYKKIRDEINRVMPNLVSQTAPVDANNKVKMSPSNLKANAINICTKWIFACDNAISELKDRKKKREEKAAKKKANESAINPKELAQKIASAAKKATEGMSDETFLAIYSATLESLENESSADPNADLDDEVDKKAEQVVDSIENLTEDAEIPFVEENPTLDPEDLDDEDLDDEE